MENHDNIPYFIELLVAHSTLYIIHYCKIKRHAIVTLIDDNIITSESELLCFESEC